MRILLLLATAAAPLSALLVWTPLPDSILTPSCLTNADTAVVVEQSVRRHLTLGDSAQIVSKGIPYNPAIVQVVTTEATCSAVIAAYNGLLSPPEVSKQIQSAYVVQAGGAYALRGPVSASHPTTYYYFDSTYTFKFSLAELD
ncbi:MAG: hypothetical protein ILNGONEN_00950 [Syntrophorhabdaceae bacterium]|nr:hypothetical protein [Syntrophorhabdaceae bacterium]